MSSTHSLVDPSQHSGRKHIRSFIAVIAGVRWAYALIAFCLAATLWYAVTVRDKVETWVDIAVQFKGAPANLVIRSGLINKLAVRVHAAKGLSSSLQVRDASIVVDLSTITRGSNAITVTRNMLPFTAAYQVVEVSPARILVVADTMASREIELESEMEGKLTPDLFVESVRLDTPKITVSGAESLVSSVPRIVLPVTLAPDMVKGRNVLTVAVPAPANVTVTPPQVGIEVVVGVRTKTVTLVREVAFVGHTGGGLTVSPDKVSLVVNVPESLARNQETLDKVTTAVSVPPDFSGVLRSLGITVALPENAELVSVTPSEVTVSGPVPQSESQLEAPVEVPQSLFE